MPYSNGFNPYQQPYSYFNQRPSIPGKTITNPNEILPQDVPMDGSIGLFPVQDHSCIYAKAWNSNGTIATVRYVPEQPATATSNPDPQVSNQQAMMEKLDRIEEMLKQKQNNRNRKRNEKGEDNESTVVD